MNSPSPTVPSTSARLERLRPREHAVRRRVVVAFGIAILTSSVAASLSQSAALLGLISTLATLIGILTALGLGVLLRWSVHGTADLPDEQLDERLVRERDAAYLVAYQIIATVVVVMAVGLDMTVSLLERSSIAEVSDIARVTGALMVAVPPLALFAPSAVLAWRRTEV